MSDGHRKNEDEAGREREEAYRGQEELHREQEEAPREQEEAPREQEEMRREQEEKPREFQVQIDRVHYTVTKNDMTGAQLRQVPPTPIGPDRDLFEVVLGGPDKKIADSEIVEIRSGKRFFTAPTQINPG